MARTEETFRRTKTGKLLATKCLWRIYRCYNNGPGKRRHTPTSINRRHIQRPKSHYQNTASSKIVAYFKCPKYFPHFVKLPHEIQYKIWEILAKEPRVVAINTKTNGGLYSSIPPILHVCSESRAVGLKHYTLAFESRVDLTWTNTPEQSRDDLPPRVYFNFERDMLYFRERWNKSVDGAWSCLSQFTYLVNESDLKKVRRVGLDVNARVCSLKTSGETCHYADFAGWDALETLYIGYEDVRLGSDCPITYSELESKDYEGFMQRYKMNPCWTNWHYVPQYAELAGAVGLGDMVPLPQDVEAAVWCLRNEIPVEYHGQCLKKLELVSIKHL